MGCVSSKGDINDRHPNIFQVTNVNDQLRPISPGKLEVTETELIFYQRRKMPTKWPLRSLRKYGFDTEVFSFECGRRCPTGQGIYAFQCKKAEQLFNIVHQNITGNVNDENNTTNELRRQNVTFQTEGYLNPITAPAQSRVSNTTQSRPGSVSSNSPLSPTLTINEQPIEHNNNKRGSLTNEPTYTNTIIPENITPPYVNLGNNENVEAGHVYMNVETNLTKDLLTNDDNNHDNVNDEDVDNIKHCYANIDAKDAETVPQTPTIPYASDYTLNYITVHEVNYAELDLDEKVVTTENESPKCGKKSYATIDFQKTTALSQSINPAMVEEEGIRKTRHNSTINYNNSLSD